MEGPSLTTPNFINEKIHNPSNNLHKNSSFPDDHFEDFNKILTIDEIEGGFTTHAFTDDSVLFINRAGDLFYYNLLSKNIFTAEKQHPGLFSDA